MDTSWSAAYVHERATDGHVGAMPAPWGAVDVRSQAIDSIGRRQELGWGGIGNDSAGLGPWRGTLELDEPCAPSGGSEELLARCQALRQQWATVKNDTAFNALQKLTGVTPDASAYAPGGSSGDGGPDLSSALALLQATDMPDLETFKQNARTMPDLETFKQQRISSYMPFGGALDTPISPWHVSGRTGGGAGQTGPAWPSWTSSPWAATSSSALRALSPPPARLGGLQAPAALTASPPSPWAPPTSWAPFSPSTASPLSPAPAAGPLLFLGAQGTGLGALTRPVSPAGCPSWARA